MTQDARRLIRSAYREFNARQVEDVLNRMTPDVTWPNGMEGGFVYGREAVRAYWQRQWETLDPHVEPLKIVPEEGDTYRVKVHQVVRDKEGNVLMDTIVFHCYQVVGGLIQRMDIQ